jgi:hypothetical protein
MAKAYDPKILTAIAAIWTLPPGVQVDAACDLAAPVIHKDIVANFDRKKNEKRKAMSRADCQHEGCWGPTTQEAKEKSGVLRSFLDGKKRLITVDSFYEHLITRLILSHPANRTAPKATATRTRFVARKAEEVRGENSETG